MTRARKMCLPPNLPAQFWALARSRQAAAVIAFFCALGVALAIPAHAQEGDTDSLRQQVQSLTQRVDKLETEVHALQHVQAQQPAAPVSQSFDPEASRRHAWNELKEGMAAADVKKILGPPSSQFKTGNITVWYYHYSGVGSGSVTISSDGKLSDWQRPSHGW